MEHTKESLQYLVELGRKAGEVITVGDALYLKTADGLDPILFPAPAALQVCTLQGLVDYVRADVDHLFPASEGEGGRFLLRIDNYASVTLLSGIHGPHAQRDKIAFVQANAPQIMLDEYLSAEDFVIMVMTRFLEDENRQKVLAIASNLVDEQTLHTADDGISQRATVRKGISMNGEVTVKNPVFLRPRRTFVEAEQPASPFVLRVSSGGKVGLYEADGGAWKHEAVANVSKWLHHELDEIPCVKIIA